MKNVHSRKRLSVANHHGNGAGNGPPVGGTPNDEAGFTFHYKLAYLSQEQIGKQSMKRKQAFAFQYSATVLPKGLLSWFPQTPLIEHLFLVPLALLDEQWSEKRCNILRQPPSIELSDSQIAL